MVNEKIDRLTKYMVKKNILYIDEDRIGLTTSFRSNFRKGMENVSKKGSKLKRRMINNFDKNVLTDLLNEAMFITILYCVNEPIEEKKLFDMVNRVHLFFNVDDIYNAMKCVDLE